MPSLSLCALIYPSYILTLIFCSGMAHSTAQVHKMPHDRYSNITLAGDIFSFALPAIGVLEHMNLSKEDSLKATKILIATGGVVQGADFIKRIFRNTSLGERPNGYHSSFPSAHSCNAFYGARLIHKSFGIEYGAPAYALATLTAYSRVQGHYHHVHDVIAGAALAFAIDHLVDEIFECHWLSPMTTSSSHGDRVQIGLKLHQEF